MSKPAKSAVPLTSGTLIERVTCMDSPAVTAAADAEPSPVSVPA